MKQNETNSKGRKHIRVFSFDPICNDIRSQPIDRVRDKENYLIIVCVMRVNTKSRNMAALNMPESFSHTHPFLVIVRLVFNI